MFKKIKFHIQELIILTLILSIVIYICGTLYNYVRYPELYEMSSRYHLENNIKSGDTEAITYYNERYVSNGIILFD